MLPRNAVIAAMSLVLAAAPSTANAFERGYTGAAQKFGVLIGAAAEAPPAGIYMFDQFATFQSHVTGPGAPIVNGKTPQVNYAAAATGFLFVPGWNILGAWYDAVIVTPFMMYDASAPYNINPAGMHNTFIAPIELSWRLGDSGFFAKAGLGMYVPDGTISGPNGLSNVGAPFWTFQPDLVLSYFKDGWNLTANISEEFNTASTVTGYRSGNVLHAEFTATKRIGKWTFGPVGYFGGQVSNDKSSAFYGGAINTNRYGAWAVGALVGYDFGPVALNVWATDEISVHASGGTFGPGIDSATFLKGYTVIAQLSYRLWAPDENPAPSRPMFHK